MLQVQCTTDQVPGQIGSSRGSRRKLARSLVRSTLALSDEMDGNKLLSELVQPFVES